jgi:hypothetical protein
MAGVKVTDLPVLSAADLADIFYVVDSSANQSKQIDLATIAGSLSTILPFINLQGTTTGGQGPVTGVIDCEAGGTKGARIIFTYQSGDTISFGGEYNDGFNDYPTITFFNNSNSQTLQLYMRGGDLILLNETLGAGTSNIIQSFSAFNNQRVLYGISTNQIPSFPNPDAGREVLNWNNLPFISNGGSTQKSWTPLPTHYFNDSCQYTQIGTNAPNVDSIFETQVGFLVGKSVVRVGIGHYHITYDVGVYTALMPTNTNRVKVIATSGNDSSTCVISAQVSFPSATQVQISIHTRGNSGANDGLLKGAFIDVYWYKF